MQKVTPTEPGSHGKRVRNLHEALRLFLQRNILEMGEQERETLERHFRREWEEQAYGEVTTRLVQIFQEQHQLEAQGAVDEATAEVINGLLEELGLLEDPNGMRSFLVKGSVVHADGRPLYPGWVRAYDQDLRRRELLGEARTDEKGRYRIQYGPEQFSRAEKESADLLVVALLPEGEEEVAHSEILFNAREEETIDLVVGNEAYRGPSEYELLVEELRPLLDDISFADLTEDEEHHDISFLSGETGIDAQRIDTLAEAHRFRAETDVPAEVFYGLFREGMPMELRGLLMQSPELIRRSLLKAVNDNIISTRFGERADEILDRLQGLIVRLAFEPPHEEETKVRVVDLLGTVLEQAQQQEFVSAYVAHKGPIQKFWQGLREHPGFRGKVEELQFTLQLGVLTRNHLPLVRELQRRQREGEITSLVDLARYSEADWLKIITERHSEPVGFPPDAPGKDDAEKAGNYARALAHRVEDAFPTAFVVHRLREDELEGTEDIPEFLFNNPQFDIRTTHIETFLAENPDAAGGMPKERQEIMKDRLSAIQRVYKVAPRYTQTSFLLGKRLNSAYAISHLGKKQSALMYGDALGGQDQAMQIVDRAKKVTDMAMAILPELNPGLEVKIRAVGEVNHKQVKGRPDWRALFGSLDFCDCEHCQSVYGPAAYLVDILHFLKNRKLIEIQQNDKGEITSIKFKQKTLPDGTKGNKTVQDVLFERRPDLGEIELTCENTSTPVPYVDLVNEILEDYIVPPEEFKLFTLDTGLETDLDQATLSNGLRQSFTDKGYTLDPQATVRVRKKGQWWTVDDLPFSYTIRKERSNIKVTTRGRQTNGTPEELGANPQYINQKAYDILSKEVFPWQMPFDLSAQEARLYLDHLGVKRHQIMETFLPGDRKTLLDRDDIAREYLGITSQEAQIIVGKKTSDPKAATPGEWNLWGFDKLTGQEKLDPQDFATWIANPADSTKWIDNGHWLSDVLCQRVDVFLQQSGLKYKDVLDLFVTHTISPVKNPGERTITVKSKDAKTQDTCDLDQLRIDGLDKTVAHKIVRFVRLWRRLNCQLFDLDRLVLALGKAAQQAPYIKPHELDDSFLVSLSHVMRLHEALDVPLEHLAAWWASNLGDSKALRQWWTLNYIDHHAKGQPRLPSLYARLFRNKAVINPVDPAFTEDPEDLQGKLSSHEGAIAAALGISAEDLSLLVAAVIKGGDTLNLGNLSELFRHVTLAKALDLKIRDYLSVLALYAGDPFASPLDTLSFTEHVDNIRASGFSITELDYLLRHTRSTNEELAPSEDEVTIVLGDIRAGLQTVAAENTFPKDPSDPQSAAVDPHGDLTRAKLALLNWDSGLIDRIIATLNDEVTYRTTLSVLPDSLELPNATGIYEVPLAPSPVGKAWWEKVRNIFTYDQNSQKLQVSHFLLPSERKKLLQEVNDQQFKTALQSLFKQQDELQGKITYDPKAKELCFQGVMTKARRDKLKGLSNEKGYPGAIDILFNASRTFIKKNLRTFFVPDFSEKLVGLPADVVFPAAFKDKIYFDAAAGMLHFKGVMTETERDTLLALANDNTDPYHTAYKDAIKALFAAADVLMPQPDDVFLMADDVDAFCDNPTMPSLRFAQVLEKLLPYLRKTLSRRLVIQKIGEALGLEIKATRKVLASWVEWPGHAGEKAIEAFLADIFVESSPNLPVARDRFKDQFDTYLLLHKIALVISRLELTPKQLGWLFEYGPAVGWPDMNKLPLTVTKPADSKVLKKWERLWRLCQLRDHLPRGEALLNALFDLAQGVVAGSLQQKNAAKGKYFDFLITNLNWHEGDLQELLGPGNDCGKTGLLQQSFPDDFCDERVLCRLQACFRTSKRFGLSAKQCKAMSAKDVDPETARNIRQALRSRYEEDQWLKLARPLRDKLREKQRAALVAYLLAHPDKHHPWRRASDIYDYFLIDVEMSPCQMTSRIRQASLSVQLFVQRCLMNLEPEVVANAGVDEHWREWNWMKNYRVWEANRKVFLYPENWIEPELRDDKSPFFKALESELMQGDLTKETAEAAFRAYLEKLDQIASPQIVGMYHQVEKDLSGNTTVDILHVFGRTDATPHVYYYRQLVDGSDWTAWERIDLDIEGDHLIPVMWNHRLYLFWPIFTPKAHEMGTSGEDKKITDIKTSEMLPKKYWEIKLAWSERKKGKWTNKKISSNSGWVKQIKNSTDETKRFIASSYVGAKNELVLQVIGGIRPRKEVGRSGKLINLYLQSTNNCRFLFDGCHSEPTVRSSNSIIVNAPPTGTKFFQMFFKEDNGQRLYLPAPTDTPALNNTPGTFYLLPHADGKSIAEHPFFFQDDRHTFFVTPPATRWPAPGLKEGDDTEPDVPEQIQSPKLYYEIPLKKDLVGPISTLMDPSLFETGFPTSLGPSSVPSGGGMAQGEVMQTPTGPRTETVTGGSSLHTAFVEETRLNRLAELKGLPPLVPMSGGLAMNTMAETGAETGTLVRRDTYAGSTSQSWWAGYKPLPESSIPFIRPSMGYRFETFYHPYVCAFVKELNAHGVAGLLRRPLQRYPELFQPPLPGGIQPAPLNFKDEYGPEEVGTPIVIKPYPKEEVDFGTGGYALYNWELFFHIPFLIANRLSQNQRFAEARDWFHYIFDPTDASGLPIPNRYWKTKRFFETSDEQYRNERIQNLQRLLVEGKKGDKHYEELVSQVQKWQKDPFKQHLIARLRITAYQKSVVMKYIDNLIAWGDQLFRRDTMESINEATQLYILVADLLGRRPEEIPPRGVPKIHTYNSLEQSQLGPLSNALVEIERFISPSTAADIKGNGSTHTLTLPAMLYFCVPKNKKLLGYWDTVEDRLFKIRHCMNIEGVVRQLPLFAPPIDPGLLIKAAAAGVDISSALSDINAPLPYYRFNVMAQKASELCAEVKSLGAALLSALEKRDAEDLALLRAGHEAALLKKVEDVKKDQIKEAKESLEALRKSRKTTVARYLHYQKLLGVKSPQAPAEGETLPDHPPSPHVSIKEEGGVKMIPYESSGLDAMKQAHEKEQMASEFDFIANFLHSIPSIKAAPWGIGAEFYFGFLLSSLSHSYRSLARESSFRAKKSDELAKFALRQHDWTLQSNLAAKEIMHIDKEILVAETRKAVAEKELENHRKKIQQAEEVETFLRDKYTNKQLYSWMVGQISGIYFQTYQLTYDVAKRAERAYRHELGLEDSNFIQFGYWDSLKKGLLAGERLAHDIKRMEVSYLEKNRREYEITKNVSLLQVDPLALIKLRMTGSCKVSLPEELFDMDGPGHYFRRIKSVALTIPCVAGPYAGVDCKLTLLKSSVRSVPKVSGDYARDEEDDRFIDYLGSTESIVASSSQNDSGLFETNLRDERYLPFEGSGGISQWRIELPANPSAGEPQQFDYNTISDVILHIRYTACDGGEPLRSAAMSHLKQLIDDGSAAGMARLFSVRHEFPTEWAKFQSQTPPADQRYELKLDLRPEHYPFWSQGRLESVVKVELFARRSKESKKLIIFYDAKKNNNNQDDSDELKKDPSWNNLFKGKLDNIMKSDKSIKPIGELDLYFKDTDLEDLWVLLSWKE